MTDESLVGVVAERAVAVFTAIVMLGEGVADLLESGYPVGEGGALLGGEGGVGEVFAPPDSLVGLGSDAVKASEDRVEAFRVKTQDILKGLNERLELFSRNLDMTDAIFSTDHGFLDPVKNEERGGNGLDEVGCEVGKLDAHGDPFSASPAPSLSARYRRIAVAAWEPTMATAINYIDTKKKLALLADAVIDAADRYRDCGTYNELSDAVAALDGALVDLEVSDNG